MSLVVWGNPTNYHTKLMSLVVWGNPTNYGIKLMSLVVVRETPLAMVLS